jgi:hypothetical protein
MRTSMEGSYLVDTVGLDSRVDKLIDELPPEILKK